MKIIKPIVAMLAPPASGKRAAVSTPQCTQLKLEMKRLTGLSPLVVTEHAWSPVLPTIYQAMNDRLGNKWRYPFMLASEKYPLSSAMLGSKRQVIAQTLDSWMRYMLKPSGTGLLAVIGDIDVFFALLRHISSPAAITAGVRSYSTVILTDFPVHQHMMAKKCNAPLDPTCKTGLPVTLDDADLGRLRERYLAMAQAAAVPVSMGWSYAFRSAYESLNNYSEWDTFL